MMNKSLKKDQWNCYQRKDIPHEHPGNPFVMEFLNGRNYFCQKNKWIQNGFIEKKNIFYNDDDDQSTLYFKVKICEWIYKTLG